MTVRTPQSTGARRLGLIVGGLVLLAVVAAAVVQAVRPAPELDADTPEGVVQAFLVAIAEERYEDAHDLLSSTTDCDQADLATDTASYTRVVVDDVRTFDEETLVILRATVFEGEPLDQYSYETTLEFRLENEGGIPRISQLPFTYFCG